VSSALSHHVMRGRIVALLSAGSLLAAASAGCSPHEMRDCGWSITWRHTEYLGLGYVLGPLKANGVTDADIRPVAAGRKLGTGYVPQCPGDSSGTATDVYAIDGIDPAIAIVTRTHLIGIAKGHSLPPQLLRKQR
jgi:hypothetical protein